MAEHDIIATDPWTHLKAYTRARIALGRTGGSMPTDEVLRFGYAHAMARDAVHLPLDYEAICSELQQSGLETIQVSSAASDRHTYLLRPDLGRRLDESSRERLRRNAGKGCDLLVVVGDGLSSLAVRNHVPPLLEEMRRIMPPSWSLGPVVVASQARVALSDDIGALLEARAVVMLVGERPGLSSPDSLGVYLTYAPQVGRQDSDRNCISNVRPEGLSYAAAARKTIWLVQEAMRLRLSGIGLKDQSDLAEIAQAQQPPSLPSAAS